MWQSLFFFEPKRTSAVLLLAQARFVAPVHRAYARLAASCGEPHAREYRSLFIWEGRGARRSLGFSVISRALSVQCEGLWVVVWAPCACQLVISTW